MINNLENQLNYLKKENFQNKLDNYNLLKAIKILKNETVNE